MTGSLYSNYFNGPEHLANCKKVMANENLTDVAEHGFLCKKN
jgi:hypothetical protein